MNDPPLPEDELLRQARAWLGSRELDADELRRLSAEQGLDFATAVLYEQLRQSPRHGPMIAEVDAPPGQAGRFDAEIAIVPGGFYKENPHTGADGRLIRDSAVRLGYAAVTIPLHSFGTVADNSELLAKWLRDRAAANTPLLLASHSKGSTEIRRLLSRGDAAELFQNVAAWVDLSGLFLGTPLVGWLRKQRLRSWMVRTLFWWKGYSFSALDEIDSQACPPWPGALDAVGQVNVVHVVGFPLERHLSTALVRRGHGRLSPLGPNDGTIPLTDVFALPGRVYPVWGADHYLRPRGRDMTLLIAGILGYLARDRLRLGGRSATPQAVKELS